VQGLALLLLLVLAAAPAAALTPAELRAMRESAAKAHRLLQHNGQLRTMEKQPGNNSEKSHYSDLIYSMYYSTEFSEFLPRGRPAVSHKVVPAAAAPPSNLGGRVTSEKGLKEWHAKQALSQMSALQGLLIVNILGQ